MIIKRLQYNIDYVHVITFREEYKKAISPYFGFDNLRYGIDNENTIHESVRLIFQNEHIALFLRKEGFSIVFEGDTMELQEANGIMKPFWDLFEKIKRFEGYKKATRHTLIVNAVDIDEGVNIDEILRNNPYFTNNPFGELKEFACVYEFQEDDKYYKFEFGNFSERDIKTYDLRPFNSTYTEDLIGARGLMCRLEINEPSNEPNHRKFKSLLRKAEKTISTFIENGRD
jgi:hypothetical protein